VRYLSVGDVARIHEQELQEAEPIFDFGLLESAVMRPQQTVGGQDAYPTLHVKAAALMHSLIRNHPFVDGNKRTAVIAVGTFYLLNGYSLEAEQGDVIALAVDVAEGQKTVEAIAKDLQQWSVALDLNDFDEDEAGLLDDD
jgi:death-on-curing protein